VGYTHLSEETTRVKVIHDPDDISLMSRRLIEKTKRILKDEVGGIYKDPAGRTKVALVYPNTYHIGMSNLGFQAVYGLLNQRDDVLCERAFLPDEEDREGLLRNRTLLFTLESQGRLIDFDIIAFSVSFENDYLNILDILRLSRIPLMREDRKDNYPLVILGGMTSFVNPEPLSDFFDLIVIGEAEEIIDQMMTIYKGKAGKSDRDSLISDMASIEGIYIPGFYEVIYNEDGTIKERIPKKGVPERIRKRYLRDIDRYETYTRILTPHTEFSNTFLIELSRGCGRGCRFCLEDFIYRPPRRRKIESILDAVKVGTSLTNRIRFIGADVLDPPEMEGLLRAPETDRQQISVPSLRVDTITDDLIRGLAEKGLRTISIAPEAGSERLRRVINKGIKDDDIIRTSEIIFKNGILNLKIYFMIGLPTETIEDIKAIIDLIKKVHEIHLRICREKGGIGLLTVGINSFIPKPFTPFQWSGMEDIKTLKEKINLLKKGLKGMEDLNLIHDIPKWASFQAFLSRGDRRVGRVLRLLRDRGDWTRVSKESGIDPEFYISRERDFEEILPWDFIDTGVRKDYLWQEYEMIRKGVETPPCMVGSCTRCGVC